MWEYTPPPRIGVIQHSAKGTTWSKKNPKYIKKVGNKYIYDDGVNAIREVRDPNKKKYIKRIGNDYYYTDKDGKKILGKVGEDEKIENKKTGKSGAKKTSSGSKVKAEKESKTKKEKTEKKLTEKKVKRADAKTGIKTTISKYAQVGQNDSIYATALEDGQWTVEVEFENGDVQTFTLDADYNLVSKSDKKKK